MADLTELVEALADLIADKVAERLGGEPPAPTQTPDLDDGEPEPAPKKATRKRTKAAESVPETGPDEDDEDDEEDDEEETTDLVTQAQLDFVAENVEDTDQADKVSELTAFFVECGQTKKEVTAILADMSEEDIDGAYGDYLARLVKEEDGELDFITEDDEHYKATRVNDGEESLHWISGGQTLSEEEVEEAGLGDPNAKSKKKAPAKRTKPARK